jgi:hypothetical protein
MLQQEIKNLGVDFTVAKKADATTPRSPELPVAWACIFASCCILVDSYNKAGTLWQ